MHAVKLVGPGSMELQDVPVPQIGADDVLVKVAGAGLCHSDLHVLHMGEEWPFFGGTVGHEGAGWVEKPVPTSAGSRRATPCWSASSGRAAAAAPA